MSWVAPEFVRRAVLAPIVRGAGRPSPLAGHPLYAALMTAVTVVFAPAAEELLFRGALLRRWTARWGARPALVASALLFGLLHPPDVLGGIAFGACMALLARRTGTLLVPIGADALNNGLVEALAAVSRISPADAPWRTLAEFRSGAWWIALAWVPTTAALAVAMRGLRRRAPRARRPAR